MEFKEGAKVFTADGETVGHIDRVVLDPESKEVTHLVVQKGFLFREDKVVPMSLVGPAGEDQVRLRVGEDELEELPDFRERQFVAAEGTPDAAPRPRPLYWYPPRGPWWTTEGFAGYAKPGFVVATENIPLGTVALEEGSRVISRDGKRVGTVERILADPVEHRVTHLVLAEGLLRTEKTLIPSGWLASVAEDEVHLTVDAAVVERLPAYEAAE